MAEVTLQGAKLTAQSRTYTLEVSGVVVVVAINKRHPHSVTVNGRLVEVESLN